MSEVRKGEQQRKRVQRKGGMRKGKQGREVGEKEVGGASVDLTYTLTCYILATHLQVLMHFDNNLSSPGSI